MNKNRDPERLLIHVDMTYLAPFDLQTCMKVSAGFEHRSMSNWTALLHVRYICLAALPLCMSSGTRCLLATERIFSPCDLCH